MSMQNIQTSHIINYRNNIVAKYSMPSNCGLGEALSFSFFYTNCICNFNMNTPTTIFLFYFKGAHHSCVGFLSVPLPLKNSLIQSTLSDDLLIMDDYFCRCWTRAVNPARLRSVWEMRS